MARYILEIHDDETELIAESSDDVIWTSYEDDDFGGDPTDAEAVTEYLVKKDIIESEHEIVEIVDEIGDNSEADDDDDDDDNENEPLNIEDAGDD